jgi:multiple sugar transport system ATP-binding protein
MNLVNGTLSSDNGEVKANFADISLTVDSRSLERHPGIENQMGETIVMGIRPGDFEAAAVAGAAPGRTMEANVDVAEMLGSETFVHYHVDTPPVMTPDIEELLADSGADLESLGDTTNFSSRVSSDVVARPGDRIELVVDTSKMHFFDPGSGLRIGAKATE